MDMVLLLYLLKGAGDVYGRTKIQKTVFLTEFALVSTARPVLPHYTFFRYYNGPFSRQLWDDCDDLTASGFLGEEDLKPTERGDYLIELVVPELRSLTDWQPIFATFDSQLDFCRSRNGAELINYVYGLTIAPSGAPWRRQLIKDVAELTDLIEPHPGAPAIPDWLTDAVKNEIALTSEELAIAVSQARAEESELISRLTR